MFTKTRLITKTISWRIIGFIITLIVAFIETKNFGESGLISLIDGLVKILLMYLYDLAWLRVGSGVKVTNGVRKEMKRRIFIRTTIWRILAMIITMIIAYAVTLSFKDAITIGVIDVIVKTVFLYIHEFAWSRVKWGVIDNEEKEENDDDVDIGTLPNIELSQVPKV